MVFKNGLKLHVSKFTFIILIPGLIAGCDSKLSVGKFSQLVVSSLSCENFEVNMFDNLLQSLDRDKKLPDPEDLKTQLHEDFKNIKDYENLKPQISIIINDFIKLYNEIYTNTPMALDQTTILEIKSYLMAIETKDQMKLNKVNIIETYQTLLNQLQVSAKNLKQTCFSEEPIPEPPMPKGTLLEHLKSNENPEVYGAYKTFSTAYQNCESALLPALGNTTASLKGVQIVGRHPSGGGNLRQIGSLRDVQKTHPYLNERPQSSSCYNTFNNPLIYDYGGKPKSIDTASSDLNFFINDGSGTKALGTDCSGFVFSSLVSAGLKLDPNVTVRARQVLSYGASRFVDPVKGNVKCFEKVEMKPNANVEPGDILASSGHILIITKVAEDSLGLLKTKNINDCEKISSDDFNFELMQSSPSLGAIGINKMKASDYLSSSSTMRIGMVNFAKKLCQSKYNGQTHKQTSTSVSLVRHKKNASCRIGSEIQLTGQSCIQSCPMN